MTGWAGPAAALAIGLAGGALAAWLHMPLPWMLGALAAVAAVRIAGWEIGPPAGARQAGQVTMGVALGLYFTPAVAAMVAGWLPVFVLAGAVTLLYAAVSARWVARLTGASYATAFFGTAPGGITEMVVQGERFAARGDLVAAAQSARLVLVVVAMPLLFLAFGAHDGGTGAAARPVAGFGPLALVGAAAVAAAMLFERFALPSGWFNGALLVALAAAASGLVDGGLPPWIVIGGQWLVGSAVGTRFSRAFFRRAPRFLAVAGANVALGTGVFALSGALLARLQGIDVPSFVLGVAPGGVAEMGIVAQAFGLAVPVVTALQVLRMSMVQMLASLLFRRLPAVGEAVG